MRVRVDVCVSSFLIRELEERGIRFLKHAVKASFSVPSHAGQCWDHSQYHTQITSVSFFFPFLFFLRSVLIYIGFYGCSKITQEE